MTDCSIIDALGVLTLFWLVLVWLLRCWARVISMTLLITNWLSSMLIVAKLLSIATLMWRHNLMHGFHYS